MLQDTNNLPTLKEVEVPLFRELQSHFQDILTKILEELDVLLMENRDHKRLAYHEKQACTMDTLFGPITINRRKYIDRETSERVALLDQTLQFKGSDSLSPFLTDIAVEWAVKGPSYRDAKHRLEQLLGYPVISHEQIRQKVLQLEARERRTENVELKQNKVLFLEIDGLNASDGSCRIEHEPPVQTSEAIGIQLVPPRFGGHGQRTISSTGRPSRRRTPSRSKVV